VWIGEEERVVGVQQWAEIRRLVLVEGRSLPHLTNAAQMPPAPAPRRLGQLREPPSAR
jgi:hypothetical protein